MKVLIINTLGWDWPPRVEALREEFPEHEFIIDTERDSAHLAVSELIVAYALSPWQVEKAAALKCLCIPYTGVNLFPLKELSERGIILGNSHGNGRIVAEHALALAMTLLHQIPWRQEELRKGYWHRSFTEPDFWPGLTGKRCAVLGTGGVGGPLARMLKALDCHVTGYRRSGGEAPEGFDDVTTDLDKALESADIVFICLPGTGETEGLIGKDRLARMKGKYLVNVARGQIVDEDALHWALSENVLAGAALDVWYNYHRNRPEPISPSEKGVHLLPNVVASPHNATHNALAKGSDMEQTLENIRSYIRTGRPINVVDLGKGY